MKARVEPHAGDMLVAENIAIARGGLLLFAELSFRIRRGEALILMGPNGAGKTSLMRAIAGLLPLAAGRLDNPFASAWVSPEMALKPDRHVIDELRFWAGLDGGEARIEAACAAMGADLLLDMPCGYLSSGQRQRVNIARAIISGAPLWLLDEPANALDAASVARLVAAIARHRDGGGLAVVATHQPLPLPDARTLQL